MESNLKKKVHSILRVLADAGGPLQSGEVAEELASLGIELKPRMVRYYLQLTDERGWTLNRGRSGRLLTVVGRQQLRGAVTPERISYVSSRIEDMVYQLAFELRAGRQSAAVNRTFLRAVDLAGARPVLKSVFDAGFGFGRRVAIHRDGESVGSTPLVYGESAISTLATTTLDAHLRHAGVMTQPRFSGILEIRSGQPHRFVHVVHFDGSTIDPAEVFLKSGLLSVRRAAETGEGSIGAGFREIPAIALEAACRGIAELEAQGLGAALLIGKPGRPVLDIPVPHGRVGMVVAGGLNPIAALEESGISTMNEALAQLLPLERLQPLEDHAEPLPDFDELRSRIASSLRSGEVSRESGIYE